MTVERWLHIVRLRIRSLIRRSRVEDELSEEVRFHLEERARELVAHGMSVQHAHDAALRAFGGLEQRKEDCRDARRVGIVEDLGKDIAYALRGMRRTPGFTAVAVLSLALGIGANTAIFAVFDALILRPLPVDRPEELRTTHVVLNADSRGIKRTNTVSYDLFRDLQADTSMFSDVLAIGQFNEPVVTEQSRPLRLAGGGTTVSPNYFSMLGIRAQVGRLFDPRDDSSEDQAVVLSDSFWRREFGADTTVLGRALQIDGMTFTVIGVTPPRFFGLSIGRAPDFFIKMVPAGPNDAFNVQIVGRLRVGVTDAAAAQWFAAFRQAHASVKPNQPTPTIELRSAETGLSTVRQRFVQPLSILMTMVVLLLVIACANVATMLLSRASARKTEILIRSSMGAGYGRLLRQLATESVVLVAMAAIAGLLFTSWGTQALLGLMQYVDASLALDIGVDARVLLFTVVVSTLLCLLAGLAPALYSVRVDTSGALRDRRDTRTVAVSGRLSRPFVVAQVALSLTLVAGAGLLARTLHGLTSVDAGFEPDGIVLISVYPGARGYRSSALETYFDTVSQRLRHSAGVERVSLVQFSFLTGGRTTGTVDVPGFVPATQEDRWVQVFQVGAQFFGTMGIPIVEGRDFNERDLTSAPSAIALNETAARRYFGAQSAVGRSIYGDGRKEYRVIAVVRDGRYNTLREDMDTVTFVPYTSAGRNRMTYVVKMADGGSAAAHLPQLLDEARGVDPLVPIAGDTLDAVIGRSLGQERLLAIIAGFFGLTALLLMSLGLYGVMAYWVAARTSEIGVRLALGARRSQVAWDVVRRPLALISIGLLLGVGVTIAAGRFVSNLLFGLAPQDPLTMTAAIAFLIAVAIVAGAVPARRACRVDPVAALRCE